MTDHKLNHTASVAVSTIRKYNKIDANTPLGVKLILVTTERVAVMGILTAANRKDFTHWEPLAQMPEGD